MPSEIRELRFSLSEVLQAIKVYQKRVGAPLPIGSLVSCGPECDASGAVLRFRIIISPETGGTGRPQP